MQKRMVISFILSGFLILYFYLLSIYIVKNFWWILPIVFYLIYFSQREFGLSRRAKDDACRIKDCKDVRIDFW